MADPNESGLGYQLAAGIAVIVSALGSGWAITKKKPTSKERGGCEKCPVIEKKVFEMEQELKKISGAFVAYKSEHSQTREDIKEIRAEFSKVHERITSQGREISQILGILSTRNQ